MRFVLQLATEQLKDMLCTAEGRARARMSSGEYSIPSTVFKNNGRPWKDVNIPISRRQPKLAAMRSQASAH